MAPSLSAFSVVFELVEQVTRNREKTDRCQTEESLLLKASMPESVCQQSTTRTSLNVATLL
eukprot:scaffold909_cov135-Cylindrotheca_fusiformis.AAC.16